MFSNATSESKTFVEERTCNNCAKGCIVGKTHGGANLFNCTPQSGIQLIRHLPRTDCKMHQTYKERYGKDF